MAKLICLIVFVLLTSTLQAKSTFECGLASAAPKVLEPAEAANKTPVFIFYANDLAINPGYDWAYRNFLQLRDLVRKAETSTLEEREKAYLKKVSDLMEFDMTRFHEALSRQAHLVESYACGDKNHFKIGSVVLTNHSVRSPHALTPGTASLKLRLNYCRPNSAATGFERGVDTLEFNLPAPLVGNPATRQLFAQPLLTTTVLKDTIKALRRIYDPKRTQFILWMKSYGDARNVFRPPYLVDASKIEAAKLWKALLAEKISAVESAEAEALATGARGFTAAIRSTMEKAFVDAALTGSPPQQEVNFVEKEDLLQRTLNIEFASLNNFTAFPYVILESDQSALELSPNESIQKLLAKGGTKQMQLNNVGKVCTLEASPTSYEEIDFYRLFLPLGVEHSKGFLAHLENELSQKE